MKKWLGFCILLFLPLLPGGDSWAQGTATAELHVTARDPQGAVIRNATVVVRDTAHNIRRSTYSSDEGQYRFLALSPGNYTVNIEAPGFARTIVENVAITVGEIAELLMTMQLATVSETIRVRSEPDIVETQRTSSATTIDQHKIQHLPINGRNYINFALTDSKLARDAGVFVGAAPTSGINFLGQRPRANLINVDGADFVDNSTNGIRATVSQEAVQEFQILTGGFAAEYGRAAGGVVNIVTKSGTNEFHGSAFGYLRNRNLQAVNRFSTVADPAYTRVQTGITAGGPVQKERTFYFFSYEGTRRRETGYSSIGATDFDLEPFDTARLAPYLDLGGNSFGTILLTKGQVKFINDLMSGYQRLSPPQQATLLPSLQALTAPYLTLAGGGAGVALNGVLPTPAMIPVVTAIAKKGFLPGPAGLSAFPSSGAAVPPSFVPLNSLRGNYPVTEGTDLYSLRLDHQFNARRTASLRVGFSPSHVTGIQNSTAGLNLGQSAFSRSTEQTYHDWSLATQHMWVLGDNKVNELRFQYGYRGLRYDHSHAPGGSNPGVNIAGYAAFGREPISYVDRTEQRYQFTDNFSLSWGRHMLKFGGDVNLLPMSAEYTMQFGGVYNVGALRAGSFLKDGNGAGLDQLDLTMFDLVKMPVPGFSAVQAYGLGVPQSFIQGVGAPRMQAGNKTFGGFLQDTWRPRPILTLNYGVRYDVELMPELRAMNDMSRAAEDAMGVMEGIPRDLNNFAPRIGLAWDPKGEGKSVVRAAYGIFYDHPPMAVVFTSGVADGAQAPQIALFGGAPGCASPNPLNATNAFQGLLSSCLPWALNYVPGEQRFNPTPNAESVFVNQRYLAEGVPLAMQPVTMSVARDFQYGYVNQANLAIEHELSPDLSVALEYNFSGGRHLNRPNNRNAVYSELVKLNYERAMAAVAALADAGVSPSVLNQLRPTDPRSVAICPDMLRAKDLPPVWGPANFVPAAMVSFFRPSGLNPALVGPTSPLADCIGAANAAVQEFGLGVGVPVPFSDMHTNFSNASSVYHGFTANLRKRMSRHYEFLASYTWSHAIDDGSTDLALGIGPQDSRYPERERSNSLFDQRHRFVFTGMVQSGRRFANGWGRALNDWTLSPVIEVSSGRPFNILTYTDSNFDFYANSDRPMIVAPGTPPNACDDKAIASRFSPTGYFQLPCYNDATPTFTGNLGRNAGTKPWTLFTDIRIARRFRLGERMALDGIADVFNFVNRFNVLDVNPLYTTDGASTAAYDPRQFQLALRLTW